MPAISQRAGHPRLAVPRTVALGDGEDRVETRQALLPSRPEDGVRVAEAQRARGRADGAPPPARGRWPPARTPPRRRAGRRDARGSCRRGRRRVRSTSRDTPGTIRDRRGRRPRTAAGAAQRLGQIWSSRARKSPEHGLRMKTHPEPSQHAVAHPPGDAHDVRRARALTRRRSQACGSSRSPPSPSACPRANPDRSTSHAAASFTRWPSGSGQRGMAGSPATAAIRSRLRGRNDGVDEERPAAPPVRVRRIEDHRLRPADREHALAHGRQCRALDAPRGQVPRQLRVAHGRRAAGTEPVGHGEDDEAVWACGS